MSASKMRAAAAEGDLQLFSSGLPSGYTGSAELFNAVRKGMGLKEEKSFRSHIELPTVSETREKMALVYATKEDVKDDMTQLMQRFDRLESKIDDMIRRHK